jgi:DNA-binding IclR family transcriptional regulator
MDPNQDKDALKQLREARKPWIDRAKESIKAQAALIKAIRAQLEGGARTVRQIAAATGLETAQVLVYVSGLRKYGVVVEGPKDGDYFTYALASGKDAWRSSDREVP